MSELNKQALGNTDIDAEKIQGAPAPGPIGKEQISRAVDILEKYRSAKRPVDHRVAESEKWWTLNQWDVFDKSKAILDPMSKLPVRTGANAYRQTATAWLVKGIISAQADAVEAYPEPNILPREQSDEEMASMLEKIIPVLLSQAKFEDAYNLNQWRKHKSGNSIYGTFWDSSLHNGLGDIVVRKVNFLNFFYQPGVDDLQQSQNIFHTEMIDRDFLISKYPWLHGQDLSTPAMLSVEVKTEENVDKSELVEVVDWYYHRYNGTKKVLHYCKFVGLLPLYATENDSEPITTEDGAVIKEAPSETGIYDDGEYPFDMDVLYPMEGSPAGMGLIDLGKGVQENIDRLEQKIVQVAMMGATPRYFELNGAINEEEFADWEGKPIVHVKGTGSVNDSIKQIESPRLDGMYVNVLNDLKDELKQILGSTDIAQGNAPSGVVAASALAILDENQGKPKRASIRGTYRVYSSIVNKVIERIRQFYDAPRTFRILGEDGGFTFETIDNSSLTPQLQEGSNDFWQKPVFDVDVRPQKQTAYTKMAQNEMSMQLFGMGVFNPAIAEQAKQMLNMMDFKDKEKLLGFINEGQTLLNMMREYQQIALQLTQAYSPENLPGLMQKMMQEDPEGMQMSGGAVPQLGEPQDNINVKKDETAGVAKAREKTQQSSQPQ